MIISNLWQNSWECAIKTGQPTTCFTCAIDKGNINSVSPEMGFPGGSMLKNLPDKAGDAGLIPGSGRSSGDGYGNWFQYSCLRNPMDRGA